MDFGISSLNIVSPITSGGEQCREFFFHSAYILGVFAHVVVDGLVAVAVLDLDIFALRLVGADIGNGAVGHGTDGRARGRSVINVLMRASVAQNGMHAAHGVTGGNPGEGQGRFEKSLAQRPL